MKINKIFNKKIVQKGYTLVELLLVIGIITIVSALIFTGFSKRQAAVKSEAQVKWVNGIDAGIQSLAQPSDDSSLATALTNANIIAANVVPKENITGTTIENMFGGTTVFGSKSILGRTAYTITLNGIPSNACVNLATQVGYAADEVSVNATVVKTAGSTADIEPAVVAALCGNQDNSVEIGKGIRRSTDTVNVASTGYPGLNDSYLVPDIHPSKQDNLATCPAVPTYVPATDNAVAPVRVATGCLCPAGTTWSGVACFPLSAKNRTQGITIGNTIPAGDTANMRNFTLGITTGTNGNFDADQQRYVMKELYEGPYAPDITAPRMYYDKGVLRANGTDPVEADAGNFNAPTSTTTMNCINGYVWNGSTGCVPPSFNYISGTLDVNAPIAGTWDNTKLRHCVLGTNNGDRCIMPDTKTAYAHDTPRVNPTTPSDAESLYPAANPNVWKNPVRAPTPTYATCSGGQVWDGLACGCNPTTGTVFNGNYCACPSGTKYNMTGVCQATP